MNKYIVFIICLLSFITVSASEPSMEIVCPKDELLIGENIICNVTLNSDTSISNINFNYDTNLNISFTEINNYINKSGETISITYSNPLETYKNVEVLKIEVSSNKVGIAYINLNNIKVNNDISINNITKSFNIKSNKNVSSNNKLTDITVDGVSVKNFNSLVNRYENIIVNKPTAFIDIKGKDDKAMVTGVGAVMLRKNVPTEVNVRVTSEDGNVNIYTLVITYVKEVVKSHDASIDALELYAGNKRLDFVFDKDKSSFKIKIDSNIEKVLVKATLSDSKSKFIDGYEPHEINLNYGPNIIELRVESENGDIKIYNINVERSDNRNSDNTLKELIINGIEVNLIKDKYDYEVNVPFEILETLVKATPNNNKAIINYENSVLYEGNNVIIIKVTSENGKNREYRINIFRESEKEEFLPDIIEDEKKENIIENKENNIIDAQEEIANNTNYYLYIGLFCLVIVMAIIFIIIKKMKK